MKKIFAILLVVSMVFALAACGSDKEGNSGLLGNYNGGSDKEGNSGLLGNNNGSSVTLSRMKLTRGTIIGDVYTNISMGITFTKGDSWEYYTDEQLAELMGTTTEMMGVDYEQLLENTGSVYDMMVIDNNTGSNVLVMVEDLKASGSGGMSESAYLDNLQSMLNMTGVDYSFGSRSKVSICGNQYVSLTATSNQYGMDMEQVYYVRIVDDYVFGIIITLVGTPVSDILPMFS